MQVDTKVLAWLQKQDYIEYDNTLVDVNITDAGKNFIEIWRDSSVEYLTDDELWEYLEEYALVEMNENKKRRLNLGGHIITTDAIMRLRQKNDFYPTPLELCIKVIEELGPFDEFVTVLDPGAGDGPWGQAFRQLYPHAFIIGIELEDKPKPEWYDAWYATTDFTEFTLESHMKINVVIGNPPYKLAQKFIERSMEIVDPDGLVCFLLRLAFWESATRYKTLYSKWMPFMCMPLVQRPSFTGNNKTDATAYMIQCYSPNVKADVKGQPISVLSLLDWKK